MADAGRIPGPELIPNCVQVRIGWGMPSGRVAYNVLHGRNSGAIPVNVAMANSIFAALLGAFNGAGQLGTQLAANVILGSLDVRDLTPPGNWPLIATTTNGVSATGGAVMLPPNVALVGTLRTASAGQGFRGRLYQPGAASAEDQAPGTAAATLVTALTNWMVTIKAAMTAGGLTWCIAQPARAAYTGHGGRQHPARSAGMADITTTLVRNNIFDSQRRRSGRS